ncbi:MAG: alpha/beta hydrolase [bacterium]|nr:alpha/beta hydrolase [bacterium]
MTLSLASVRQRGAVYNDGQHDPIPVNESVMLKEMSVTPGSIYTTPDGEAEVMAWYNAALERFPVPMESEYVVTRYGETHLITAGNPDGPPVILLHGLSTNAVVWKPQFPALMNFRVHAVDIIGQPGKSAPRKLSLLGGDYARWLLDVFDALKIEQAAVVGLSFGGYLALKLGAYAPARVRRAMLIAPAGLAPLRANILWQLATAHLIPASYTSTLQTIYRQTLGDPAAYLLPEAAEIGELLRLLSLHRRPERHPRDLLNNAIPALPLPAVEAMRFTSPTFVLVGEKDVLFDAAHSVRRAEKVLPGLQGAEILPDAGHGLMYERVEAVNARLVRFLREELPG